MIGLLKKDIYSLLRYARIFPLFIILYAGLSFYLDEGGTFIMSTITMICVTMTISAFAYDDMAKWNAYALSLPIRRNDLVASKYLLAILLLITSLLTSSILLYVLSLWNGNFNFQDLLTAICVLSGVALIFIACLFPLIFQFGVENSRLMVLVLLAIPSAAVIAISRLSLPWLNFDHLFQLLYLLPVFGLLCFAGSLFLSIHIVSKQEF